MSFFRTILFYVFIALGVMGLTACNLDPGYDHLSTNNSDDDEDEDSDDGNGNSDDSGNDNTSTVEFTALASPGARYELTLTGDSGDLDRFELEYFGSLRAESSGRMWTATGAYENLDSGFAKLTVSGVNTNSSVTNENAPPPPASDAVLVAVNINNELAFMLPVSSGSTQIIPFVTAESCPSADFNANWVNFRASSESKANSDTEGFFGGITYDSAEAFFSSSSNFPLLNNSLNTLNTNVTLEKIGCGNGVAIDGNETQMRLFAGSETAVINDIDTDSDPEDNQYYFLMRQANWPDLNDFVTGEANQYVGMIFDGQVEADTDKTKSITATCVLESCTVNVLNDFEDQTNINRSLTLNLSPAVVNALGTGRVEGFAFGTVEAGEQQSNIACAADQDVFDTENKLFVCVGESPGSDGEFLHLVMYFESEN